MNEATLKLHASQITANIDIDTVIHEAMRSYFSGFNLDENDEMNISYKVKIAIVDELGLGS